MSFDPWDRELRERAQREDCPIPEGFSTRLEEQLERLPERSGGRKWGRRRILVLLAAALALTACTAGAANVVLHQVQYHYFDNGRDAGAAADQAAQEAGRSTAAVGYVDPGPIEDYPPLEPWDLGLFMDNMEQVYAHQYGGPADGWTEMCAGGHSSTDRIYYKADALSGLKEFWPVEPPDLEWLEETYIPLPGGQCFLDWGSDFMPIASSLNFWGRYSSAEGAPVSLDWTFYREHGVDDTYTVLNDRYQVEEYTTGDGCTVTIEWVTSDSGQRRFTAQYGCGYADFSMSGAELEPEEVYALLDHMNLSALADYQPEPTE